MGRSRTLSNRWILPISSLIGAAFIIYQNIVSYKWDQHFFTKHYDIPYFVYFSFRYLYFVFFIWGIIYLHLNKIKTTSFWKRFLISFLISAIAYGVYVAITIITGYKAEFYTKTLLFQFLVISVLSAFIGYVSYLISDKQIKELEIEKLKTENIESRYVALTNQINPHFFFNSLNGLSSLIRKKSEDDAIQYVNKLSDVFRYVLHSDKKNLVSLEEELESVNALLYMMEVRFANKLVFEIDVPEEKRKQKIPVLSLLPLLDNVVVHNIIDSDHVMKVSIKLNEQNELCVSNPVFPKLEKAVTNGTGLKNLEKRFKLLTSKSINVKETSEVYTVCLPLLDKDYELKKD